MLSITVAIPCYNGAPFIAQCIESILEQSTPPDNILVVDDGSIDDSAAIIRRYPVSLVQHAHNMGLSQARNTALENAGTDIIVYVDADAYAEPHMLECLLQEFLDNRVHGVGGQGIEAVQESIYDRWRSLHARQGYGEQRLTGCEHLFGLCMAYRRSVLAAIDGFDVRFRTNGEDVDIGYRLTDAGYLLVYTPEARVLHQRKDDHNSLRRMMHQWYYGAFIAKRKNRRNPWTLAMGTLRRLLWSDIWSDLIREQSLELAKLDVEISIIKLRALLLAAHETKDLIR